MQLLVLSAQLLAILQFCGDQNILMRFGLCSQMRSVVILDWGKDTSRESLHSGVTGGSVGAAEERLGFREGAPVLLLLEGPSLSLNPPLSMGCRTVTLAVGDKVGLLDGRTVGRTVG